MSKGVLAAIHCVEELQFQASYKADALRNLLPDTVSSQFFLDEFCSLHS